ncbi:uncharacterized protein PAC_00721 [Phialocephala subalpina]|uniref:Uncharacterized protein n=1 Tax=Phialocephala subalpina TaxID=576137 RepID=A0A1L7WDJ3_9HELO|nr:uncharacterized protein PAC_00721 [Phialocephala subalpina]
MRTIIYKQVKIRLARPDRPNPVSNTAIHPRRDLVDRRNLPTERQLWFEMLERNNRRVLEASVGSELQDSDIENHDPKDPDYYQLVYGDEDSDSDVDRGLE